VFAGCVGQEEEPVTTTIVTTQPGQTVPVTITTTMPGTTPPEMVEIVILGYAQDYVGLPFIEELEAYGAANNIKITWIPADPNGLNERVALSIAAGTHEYDIVDSAWSVSDWTTAGFLRPLNDLIERDYGSVAALEDLFLSGMLRSEAIQAGEVIALPWLWQGLFFFYRADLFAQYGIRIPTNENPLSWDEVVDAAEKLTLDTNGDGEIDIYGWNDAWHDDNLISYYWSRLNAEGGQLFDNFPDAPKAAYNNPAGVRALESMKTIWENGWIHPDSITVESGGVQCRMFYSGLGAMTLEWPFCASLSDDPEVSQIAGNWAITVPPGGSVQDAGGSGLAELYSITTTSPNPEEAWKILQYMTTNEERAVTQFVESSHLPALVSVYDHPDVLAKKAESKWMQEMVDAVQSLDIYNYPYSQQITPHFTEIFKAMVPWLQKAIKGEVPVQEALDASAAETDAILAED
jgi:multiple sugar transport system substrate-binding protein